MIKKAVSVINDFSGGQDTKTPIIGMVLNKSPNMRNFHCAGVGNRLMKRGGFAKINSSAVESDGLDVHYSPGYQTYDYTLKSSATYTQIAQGFKPNTSDTVTKVRLWLKKTGTPSATDTVTLVIQTDSSGVPSGTPVTNGTSTAVDISDTITTSYAWVTFTFSTNPTLTSGTQYHLVLQGAFNIDASNCINWGADNYDVIFANGSMSYYDGTTWVTDTGYDACFEVYITNGAEGNDGVAVWDFSSKNMLLGIFGTQLYKMDKNAAGTPDGTWDAIGGGSSWDSYTKVMLHCDGTDTATTFTDEIGKTWTARGTAQIDTAQSKFGTASGLFDGDSDWIDTPDHADFAFGTGDFTIDCWARCNFNNTNDKTLFTHYTDDTTRHLLNLFKSGSTLNIYYLVQQASGASVTFNVDISAYITDLTWHHYAIVRYGNIFNLYVDGVSVANETDTGAMPDCTSVFYVGASYYSAAVTGYFNGHIDEFRVSKGIARWTANFTPPTSAYSGDATAITSSRFWTFGDWLSGRALINTDIGLYTYTGTGNASVVSNAPIGKFIAIWKNYVFSAGIRGSPNDVKYSNLSDYSTWAGGGTLSFNTNDGDVVTGIRILKGKLYIFKRYSIHRVTYLGSNPVFQIDQILGLGSPSHYSIKEVDFGGDVGTALVFLTTDKKLAVFDGYNIQVINDNLTEESNDLFGSSDDQPLSFSDMNFKYIDLFHAANKNDTSEYILYGVLGTDTSVNYGFVFDYKTGGIYPYDGQIFSSSCFAISTNKVKKLYNAGYSGYLWEMESGNSDDSSAINAYWVSGKIKSSGISLLNKALLLGIPLKEASSGSTLNLNFQYRLDWNTTWSTAETVNYDRNDDYAFGKTALFEIGSIENSLQIKVKDNSTNPAVTIYGVELYGEPLGASVGDRATS